MKYFKKIVGKRIYLSPPSMEDVEIYTKWMNDRSVTDGIQNTSSICTLERERKWIENSNTKENTFNFAIVEKEKDQLLGNCGIYKIDPIDRTATLGIFIGEEEKRNQGYGAEAISLLLDYGFNILHLHNIHLSVFSFNERAIACYKKIGFQEYGRRHECYYLNGQYYDEVFMEVLEEDYRNK